MLKSQQLLDKFEDDNDLYDSEPEDQNKVQLPTDS